MEKDEVETIVIFRVYSDGDVFALFPAEVNYPDGSCDSYQHVGQHGAANYGHCLSISKLATEAQYRSLKLELEGLGYNLNVKKRFSKPKVSI